MIIIRSTTVFITAYVDLCNLPIQAECYIKVFYEKIYYILENDSLILRYHFRGGASPVTSACYSNALSKLQLLADVVYVKASESHCNGLIHHILHYKGAPLDRPYGTRDPVSVDQTLH